MQESHIMPLKNIADDTHRIRLLVTEDDPVGQIVIMKLLAKLGYNADLAVSGPEVLEALARYDYSLVFMDCQMPEMSGIEVTARIRDTASATINHSIPIIAITADTLTGSREKCLAAGMDDYLSKPLETNALKAVLAKWLPGSTPEEQHCFHAGSMTKRHESLSREIAQLFVAKAPLYLTRMRSSLSESDQDGVKLYAHSLKGAAITVGADRISSCAEEIEALAMRNDMKTVDQLIEHLAVECATYANELKL